MPFKTEKPEVTHSGKGRAVGSSKVAKEYSNNYAYISLTNVDTLQMLSELDAKSLVTFTVDELKLLGYKGETPGSAVQRFNGVFSTLRIPFKAFVSNSTEAKKMGKITSNRRNTTKKGEAGTSITTYRMDWLNVARTGEQFDYTMYSTTEAGHFGKTYYDSVELISKEISKEQVDKLNSIMNIEIYNKLISSVGLTEEQLKKLNPEIVSHEDAPVGMVKALEDWLVDVGQDLPEELIEKLGLSEKITELAERAEQSEEEGEPEEGEPEEGEPEEGEPEEGEPEEGTA